MLDPTIQKALFPVTMTLADYEEEWPEEVKEPRTEAEIDQQLEWLYSVQFRINALEEVREERLKMINDHFDRQRESLDRRVETLMSSIEAATLMLADNDGKLPNGKKSFDLPFGVVKVRLTQEKLIPTTLPTDERFIRVKREADVSKAKEYFKETGEIPDGFEYYEGGERSVKIEVRGA